MRSFVKISLIILAIILLQFSCKNTSPTAPENIQPGKRDYTWTVDTVNPYYTLNKLWGSSPTDVWSIGHPGDFSKTIDHYDGAKWSTDGINRFIDPGSIFGFSENNIFIGCANGRIWNYDGEEWKETTVLTKDGSNQIVFDNMWGDSSNDLYAFGAYPDKNHLFNNSVIAHYTNNQWNMLNTNGLIGIVERLYKNKTDNKIYLRTNIIGGGEYPDSNLVYEYIQGNYYKLYSSVWTQGLQADISLINGKVYFILGSRIAIRTFGMFQTVLVVANPNFYQRIWGRNSKDIFLMMTDGLAHYNGSDIGYLFYFNKIPRTQIYGAVLFDNDVFFLVYESQTGLNLIYHGKLNKGG